MQPEDAARRYAFPRIPPFPLRRDVPLEQAYQQAADALFGDVAGIHQRILDVSGGLQGWHDEGMLRAATQRPFSSVGGSPAYATGLEQAAALLHSAAKNHPFLDGNKRTAVLACCYLLRRCGYWREQPYLNDGERTDLERLVLSLAGEQQDLGAHRISAPYTVEEIATRLHRILAGSRTRRTSRRRIRSRRYRSQAHLFGAERDAQRSQPDHFRSKDADSGA